MPKRALRYLGAALAAALIAALLAAFALAEAIPVRLNATTRVYQSASASSRYVKAPKGLEVTLKAVSDGWGRVDYKGRTGYVRLKYLDRVDPIKAYVAKPATIYRNAGSDKLATVTAGTVVYVVGVDGSYVRVKNKSGSRVGYIRAGMLTSSYSGDEGGASADGVPDSLRSHTTSPSESKVEYTIYVAQNLVGAPYAESAKPPKTFDCAKFAYFCYNKAQSGAMKSSAKAQGYDTRYEKISYDNLRRGDLVCFDTVSDGDLSDHVGIYLGSGYFIHASSTAKKVIISSLSSGYYKRTFSWGRRVFNS